MPYLNLAAALFAGVYALYHVLRIVRVASTRAIYGSGWSLPLDALFFAFAGTVAVLNANYAIEGFAA